MNTDEMVAFLWDQVKKLSEQVRQHSGEVQVGYSQMCKLENAGLIPHLKKPEPEPEPEPVIVEEPEPIPEPEPEPVPEPIEKEPIPEPIPESVPEPPSVEETKPLTEDNIDKLLEEYKQKLLSSNKP
jgi:outer membrane biosynthesis protein TonB